MTPRPTAERLTPADASNVVMDAHDQVNVFLMAGVLGRGGFVDGDGVADVECLRATISGRLGDGSRNLRRFSQRLGMDGPAPTWEPCTPDLTWHVRAVEPVKGEPGLAALCAKLMATPLLTDRPLWEVLIVPGVTASAPGMILRVHHAVGDGVAVVRTVQLLFDSEPQPEPSRSPRSQPTPAGAKAWRTLGTGVTRVAAMFRATIPPTALLGPISPRRGVAFTEVDFALLSRGARAAGGTVNDALLAAVVPAVEATLTAVGEPVPQVLPASVPVALADRGTSGNAVGIMVVPLPTGNPDTASRLSWVASLTRTAKSRARSQGTYELTRTRWGSRLFAVLARRQRFVALFVTNVRGPSRPLLIAGAPLERAWPVVPIQGNVRFGVAAFSYAGRVSCAVHVDADVLRSDEAGRALGDELARITMLG